MLLATARLAIYRMCQQTFTVQNKPAAVALGPENHHLSFLRFWNLGRRKLSIAKICGGDENVVKTETAQTFVNGLLGFITLGHLYSAGSACVLLTIIA